ncbi:hypothetical protein HHK36_031046 [Tetracentron sinense]|uniref:Uncharacterized protein n=1 Tax=Tetracentron sinense TaxID=13715 RepID=A0A835CYU6_TETSI|nr:hypothetical protein HHK36_031046 [Tetracentron sinense]
MDIYFEPLESIAEWIITVELVGPLIDFVGPISFEIVDYNGSLPKLVLNPNSWTKVSSIIFADLPVGTGFSYARSWRVVYKSPGIPLKSGVHYSGITIPIVVQNIANGKLLSIFSISRCAAHLARNLFIVQGCVYCDTRCAGGRICTYKGYLLGNPVTDRSADDNWKIPHAHGMALISDELYESAKRSCGGEYVNIDPKNAVCLENVKAVDKCISGVSSVHILEPTCDFASPKPKEMVGNRRSLGRNFQEFLNPHHPLPTFGCRVNLSPSLHSLRLRNGGVDGRCSKSAAHPKGDRFPPYPLGCPSQPLLMHLLSINSGDHDMKVTFLATQAWIRSLNYSIVDDWRPWLVNVQVAGYTRSYSNHMTFATVKAREFVHPCCFLNVEKK